MIEDISLFMWPMIKLLVGLAVATIAISVPQPSLVYTFVIAFGGGMLIGTAIMEMRYA